MKVGEAFKEHPYRMGAATFLVGLAVADVVGYAKNLNYNVPEGACISPPAVSNTYVEPNTNLYLQTYTGLFTTGVAARGEVPDGAYGVQASFKAPDADAAEWDTNASGMIKADDAGRFAVKMAIGPGEVHFGVRVVAATGSPLCDQAPQVVFEHLSKSEYHDDDGQLPWATPVSAVIDLF